MALDAAKNFAKANLSTDYDAAATTIVLVGGGGAKFPAVSFNAVWFNATDYGDPADDPSVEVVRVTNIATDTLTITRAQEGTSASTHNTVGKTYTLVAGPTAKIVTDINSTSFQGDTGVKGSTGVTGTTGNTGVTGAKGDTGTAGGAGAKGDTGTTGGAGSQGNTGVTGAKGDTGVKGNTGVTGNKGDTGTTGGAGAKGDTGTTGGAGTHGDTGTAGGGGAKGDTGTWLAGSISPTAVVCSGDITATGEITAYYSDERLKENIRPIGNALSKVRAISGVYFNANALAISLGYTNENRVGVIAQDVQKVLPEAIRTAPIDPKYITVQQDNLIALLIEAVKELNTKVETLGNK